MGWFDILKTTWDPKNPNKLMDIEEKPVYTGKVGPIPPKADLDAGQYEEFEPAPGQRKKNKPKKSHQKKLPGAPVRTKVPISEFRDSSSPTGDDVRLTIQEATRMAQKEPRGHYKKLANEMTHLALHSQNADGQKQKKLLGQVEKM